MRLIGKDKLISLKGYSDDVDLWVVAWTSELTSSTWHEANDFMDYYPKAKRAGDSSFTLPVKGNSHHIKIMLCFVQKIVLITEVIINE